MLRRPASSSVDVRTPLTPSAHPGLGRQYLPQDGRPTTLKPSLKLSSSSNIVGDFNMFCKHFCAPIALSTPRVHFTQKNAGLEIVKVLNHTGKPAGEETETETEAEYPYLSLLLPGSAGLLLGSASPSQLIHELDTSPDVMSAIPNLMPHPHTNIHLETVALRRSHRCAQ